MGEAVVALPAKRSTQGSNLEPPDYTMLEIILKIESHES